MKKNSMGLFFQAFYKSDCLYFLQMKTKHLILAKRVDLGEQKRWQKWKKQILHRLDN